jgi:hypothetical protein
VKGFSQSIEIFSNDVSDACFKVKTFPLISLISAGMIFSPLISSTETKLSFLSVGFATGQIGIPPPNLSPLAMAAINELCLVVFPLTFAVNLMKLILKSVLIKHQV